MRGVLAPLAALAERTGVAIEGVMHLGKGAQRPALYRALGSVAFVAAARTSWPWRSIPTTTLDGFWRRSKRNLLRAIGGVVLLGAYRPAGVGQRAGDRSRH